MRSLKSGKSCGFLIQTRSRGSTGCRARPSLPRPSIRLEVRTRLADVVGPTEVVEGWDVRAKTQAELDAELEARKEAEADRIIDGMKALGKTLFLLVNDVRVLQGKQPITAAQFRQFLKDQII